MKPGRKLGKGDHGIGSRLMRNSLRQGGNRHPRLRRLKKSCCESYATRSTTGGREHGRCLVLPMTRFFTGCLSVIQVYYATR